MYKKISRLSNQLNYYSIYTLPQVLIKNDTFPFILELSQNFDKN